MNLILAIVLSGNIIDCEMFGEMAYQTALLKKNRYSLTKLLREELDEETVYYTKGVYAGKYGKNPRSISRLVVKECMRG